MIQQPRQVTHQLAVVDIFSHGPINHGLATPFLSYKRGISFEISSFGNRTNSALSANARIRR